MTRSPQQRTGGPLERIAGLVGRRAGLRLPREKLWLLERRVAERQRELAASSLEEYAQLLEGSDGDSELGLLLEALRVGETRFFRLREQERALRRVALPELSARRPACSAPLKVWSAGCASGEEPYTVAMILDDWLRRSEGSHRSFDILATDFSVGALDRAREGRYDLAAVEAVPPRLLERYFERETSGYRVRPEIRGCVRTSRHDLVRDPFPAGFDLVFCRNVLIYFDRPTQESVVGRLAESLALHGFLFLGTSDMLPSVPGLTQLRTPVGPIYQRTDAADRNPARRPAPQAATARSGLASQVVRLSGSYGEGESERLTGELREALAGRDERPSSLIVDLDGASYLSTDCARVLHRLAGSLAGTSLLIVARRPGVKRWVERHRHLLGSIPCREAPPPAGVGGGETAR